MGSWWWIYGLYIETFIKGNNLFRIRLVMLHFNRISAYPLTRRIPLVEQELLIYPEHEKSLKIPKG